MNITAGIFKGHKIIAPDEKITRPTLSKVRMSVFNTLQNLVEFEGASFLDMFAGSGIMALEAISRGFESAVAVEKHPKVIQVIKNNYKNFSFANLTLLRGDALKILPRLSEKFDVIFIDPPYFSGVYEQALEVITPLSKGVAVLEHVTDVDFGRFELVKQKKYGDKTVSFLKLKGEETILK